MLTTDRLVEDSLNHGLTASAETALNAPVDMLNIQLTSSRSVENWHERRRACSEPNNLQSDLWSSLNTIPCLAAEFVRPAMAGQNGAGQMN